MSEFKVGLYKHFKGNIYRVIGIATHTETEENIVIYHNVRDVSTLWARPIEMFCETVDGKPRFEYMGDMSNPCEACPNTLQKANDRDCEKCSFF